MSSTSSDDEDAYGPALPPHLLQRRQVEETAVKTSAVIGPSLPPGFKQTSVIAQLEQTVASVGSSKNVRAGIFDYESDPPPALPIHESEVTGLEGEDEDDDDDDDDIGPYPPDHPKSKRHSEQSYNKPISSLITKPKREEWMLIPPKNKPISNLASRKFLPRSLETRNDEDDETNEEQDLKEEFQAQLIERRDELMSDLLTTEGSSDRSAESLLEIHRKNLKKRKLEEAAANKGTEKKERRPFDRDSDLKINGMSADDKQRFINRATTELKGRFAHGKRAGKFL